MGCKQCQKNRERVAAKRAQLMERKAWDLQQRCNQGDDAACRTLAEMRQAQEYREIGRYRPELHQKRSAD